MMRTMQTMNLARRGVRLQRQLVRTFSSASEAPTVPASPAPPNNKFSLFRTQSHWVQIAAVGSVKEGLIIRPKDETRAQNIKKDVLPWLWLRDNCRCTSCVNQNTQQREVKTFEIPLNIQPKHVKLRDDPQEERQHVEIEWIDGHKSTYDGSFIFRYLTKGARPSHVEPRGFFQRWGSAGPKTPPVVEYGKVMKSDEGVRVLTDLIRRTGFVFVDNTPTDDPLHTKALLERIAFIRVTHYGGFYDFTADLAMADTAYTNIALPAHTDTTYFDDPAGLQAFHMLSHEPDPKDTAAGISALGGESLLVDGFNAALELRQTDKQAFHILSNVRLPWHASGNEGIAITPEILYPVFEQMPDNESVMRRVRWNNDDRGVVPFHPKYSPLQWYEAARKWNALLESERLQYWVQLKPGRTLIFDNWRVLHGRKSFVGKRRICGAYINRNDFMSRWRTLNRTPEEVQSVVIG